MVERMKNSIDRILILPKKGKDFNEQYANCLEQIELALKKNASRILHQSFFINITGDNVYSDYLGKIYNELEAINNKIASTSVIAQPPANGALVSVELITLKNAQNNSRVIYRIESGIHYTVIETGNVKELYAGGISDREPGKPFIDKVKKTYKLLQAILEKESLSFSDIVRQWNYVEQILSIHDSNGEHIQNYQVLNDVRSAFYSKAEFINGYPAATGIGMNAGGLVLEIYAVKPDDSIPIVPLKNPKQVDAYKYSEIVLVGDAIEKQQHKTTPKFERAKFISINGADTVYISGTASIQNEKTVGENNTKLQTEITIENMEALISNQNLANAGIRSFSEKLRYSFIRVYIKEASDFKVVSDICERNFKNVPIHYLIADVCRKQLLLEIEGVAESL
jgi:enamine deaminase RidA (YjgF/YER057c/UK114 family)